MGSNPTIPCVNWDYCVFILEYKTYQESLAHRHAGLLALQGSILHEHVVSADVGADLTDAV